MLRFFFVGRVSFFLTWKTTALSEDRFSLKVDSSAAKTRTHWLFSVNALRRIFVAFCFWSFFLLNWKNNRKTFHDNWILYMQHSIIYMLCGMYEFKRKCLNSPWRIIKPVPSRLPALLSPDKIYSWVMLLKPVSTYTLCSIETKYASFS